MSGENGRINGQATGASDKGSTDPVLAENAETLAGNLDGRIAKHSLVIAGHRTSISLEAAFWAALKTSAASRNLSVAALVEEIDGKRGGANLCSALRVHLLREAQKRPGPA